jgi:Immunity protein 39
MALPSSSNPKPAVPPHGRKLGLLGVSLTKARTSKHHIPALGIARDRLEKILVRTGYLDGAPFSWVTIAIRFGLRDAEVPTYQQINAKHGDLPLAIEVDAHRLLGASLDDLTLVFVAAAAKALVHAGLRYGLPTAGVVAEIGDLPFPAINGAQISDA